jgi:hypothetical protein
MGASRLWGGSKRAPHAVFCHKESVFLAHHRTGLEQNYFLVAPLQANYYENVSNHNAKRCPYSSPGYPIYSGAWRE